MYPGATDAAGKVRDWGDPGTDTDPPMPFDDSELPLRATKWSECLLFVQP